MPKILLATLPVLLVGCISMSPAREPSPTAPGPVSSSPSPVLTPGPSTVSIAPSSKPTLAPSTPSPTPTQRVTPVPTAAPAEADVYIVTKKLFAWKPRYSSYVSYLIVVELRNEGGGWAEIGAFASDYAIYDEAGGVVTTGGFLYAYPDLLGPGDTGYLVEDSVQDGYPVSDFVTLEVNGRYGDASGPPDIRFEVSNTNLRRATFGGGVEATGQVENVGTEFAESAHAAAVYFNIAGEIIGASWTNLIDNVDPGQKKAFETIDSNPVKISEIADYVVIASAD